jgi:hypothetical protein
MPIPNLIHPIPIRVQPIDRANVITDADYGEEMEVIARKTETIVSGQVKWVGFDRFKPSMDGPQEGEDGYVLFRIVDLRAVSLNMIHRGDRFVQLGGSPNAVGTDVYVTRSRFSGHYPDQNGPTLVKAFFADRQPVKGVGSGLQ